MAANSLREKADALGTNTRTNYTHGKQRLGTESELA
jgi:hypothetical protein